VAALMTLTAQDLRQFSLLSVFTETELNTLLHISKLHAYEKDQIVFLEGESIKELYFVLEGWFKAEKVSREGRGQTLRLIGPGEILNELAVFSGDSSSVSAVAMEPAVVFSLTQAQVEKLLTDSPSFSRAVIQNLAQRIQHLLNHIENLSLYPVEVRLARFLLDNAEEGMMTRQPWQTQSEIANQLGTVMDVVNRNLQKMARRGLISLDRDTIKIVNQKGLEDLARG